MIRHLAVFAFFLGGAVAITWPLVLDLSTAVPDLGDPLLIAWIIDWVSHALTHAPLELFNAPIYHPATGMLAFSEHMTGIALVVLPFHIAGLPAVAVYNIALLVGLAFSGYGAYVLARLLTGNDIASLTGGVLYAFGSFNIAHLQHLQNVWNGWLPLILAAILVYWRKPDVKRAALLAAAFTMNGLTNVHWLLFGGFALVVTIAFLHFIEPRRERAFWMRLVVALTIASLILLPFLIPYQIISEKYGERRTTFEARLGSAAPVHWLVASSRSVIYGKFFDKWRIDERELFPGVVAIALVVCAAFRPRFSPALPKRRLGPPHSKLDIAIALLAILTIFVAIQGRVAIGGLSFAGADVPAMLTTVLLLIRFAPQLRDFVQSSRFTTEEWTAALWIVIGFLGSLGWNFFLHPFLFRVITPFRATRVPARWAVIAYVGIAVFAAIGVAMLAKRRKGIAVALLALACVDVAAHIRWTHAPPLAPVYAWLPSAGAKAVIEVPMIAENIPFLYLHAQTEHRVPLVNGTSGFETPVHKDLRLLGYNDQFVAAAAREGAELLIVHEDRLTDEQRQEVTAMVAKLEPVRRFGSDAVFRIRSAPADTASAPHESPPR